MIIFDTEAYLYRAAFAATVDVEWGPDDWTTLCRHGVAKEAFVDLITKDVEAIRSKIKTSYRSGMSNVAMAFGARDCFRRYEYPDYKQNRKDSRRPSGWPALVQWVYDSTEDWFVIQHIGVEADDVMGIYSGPGRVVASSDKDMLTVPGLHFRDGALVEVSLEEADRAFFCQVLTGDATDGYPGCPGVGAVTAARILQGLSTPAEMWQAVLAQFKKKGLTEADAIAQARCAYILRPGDYDLALERPILWTPPV